MNVKLLEIIINLHKRSRVHDMTEDEWQSFKEERLELERQLKLGRDALKETRR